ncbi:MAG: Uma2 family endonuclease [Cyanobacteriota bacterium]|nr:Uma2 family endonuclease [Cyanobacteriota bacterium]
MVSTSSLSAHRIFENGDRLSRAEFHQRYIASKIQKVELIEGVVYVVSPLRFTSHGKPHGLIVGWLFTYQSNHPELQMGIEPTIRLDEDNEVQPDVVLFREGGAIHIDEDGYLTGAPDLIVEIATSGASDDLHSKKEVYQRHGVKEYIVWRTLDQQID